MKKALLVLLATGWLFGGFAQEIKFETVEHDFGLVNYNDPAVFDFVFTNTGTEPLIVQKPKSSCGCTLPSWPKDPIMPGQKDKVRVTYRTNKVGKIYQTVTLNSNAKNSPEIRLRIKGHVLEEGGIKPSQKNGRWGIEDGNGNIIIPFEYDEIKLANKGNFNVRKNAKWGIIDKAGSVIIPCEYDEIKPDVYKKDVFNVKKNGKWGIIDEDGVAIIPCEYDEIEVGFNSSYTLINSFQLKKNGKWGIADKTTGRIVIPCEYDEIFKFAETMPVKKGDKWGIIDDKNEVIIPFEYEGIELNKSNKEVLFAKKNGKWGLINKKNQVITKFFAEEMSDITETLVSFKIPTDTKDPTLLKQYAGYKGVITTKGKLLLPLMHPNGDKSYNEIEFNLVFASILKQYENIDCNQLDIEKEWEVWIPSEKEAEKENYIKVMKAIQKAIQE